jgi:hypothetical protein
MLITLCFSEKDCFQYSTVISLLICWLMLQQLFIFSIVCDSVTYKKTVPIEHGVEDYV